jgi:ABC-2 type transport system ATP-binding protein
LSYPIETYNLTKRFPVTKRYRDLLVHPFRRKEIAAFHNVNLKVEKSELFGLLGPNVAGKTTLIKTLCTLVLPTSREAFVNGLMDGTFLNAEIIKQGYGHVYTKHFLSTWSSSGSTRKKLGRIREGCGPTIH